MISNSHETKLHIFHTLGELLRTTGYDNITTRQLCKASEISRQTFYRHFQDKYDVVNWHFDLMAEDSLRQVGRTLTWRQAHVLLFDSIYKERAVYKYAYKSDDFNAINKYAYRSSLEMYIETLNKYKKIPNDPLLLFQADAVAFLGSGLTDKWCRQEMTETPKALASWIDYVLPQGIKNTFEQDIASPDTPATAIRPAAAKS